MAGLAATLNAPGMIEELTAALAPRGPVAAVRRLDGPGRAGLEIGTRGVLPAIPRVAEQRGRTVAAFALDGVASVTALDVGYTAQGPVGLLGGDDPYAVILADAQRGELVLARNGDGPGLYYARRGAGWLAASEPIALISAGVRAAPEADVVRWFVATGSCDEDESSFFAGIHRVRADQAVVLSGAPVAATVAATVAGPGVPREPRATTAAGRVGILLTPGLPGAAVLGPTLLRADRPRPLPVHSISWSGLEAPTPAPVLLGLLPPGDIVRTQHVLDPRVIDLDAYLRDMGEPVPDLDFLLLWAVVRGVDGDVDTLLDASLGRPACVSRVCDRLMSRYGVAVRCPLRGAPEGEPATIAGRALPAHIVHRVTREQAWPVTSCDLLLGQLDAVAAAVATPRPWVDHQANLSALQRLVAGEPVDPEPLLRAYLVERWLATLHHAGLVDAGMGTTATRSTATRSTTTHDITARTGGVDTAAAAGQDPSDRPEDVNIDGTLWARVPVRTAAFTPGDRLAPAAAWYVTDTVTRLSNGGGHGEAFQSPWFVAVAAKVVALSQRRNSPLWQIRPTLAARILARFARRGLPRLGEAWTMQVAIEEGGLFRVAASALVASLLPRLAGWLLPDRAALVSPARMDAVSPADASVVASPFRPDEAAEVVVAALRHMVPDDAFDHFAGCAVVAADEEGSRVLGFAPGPGADSVPYAEQLIALVLADNPSGQGRQQTPIVLALRRRQDGHSG